MSVRNTAGLNQPDPSFVKVTTARFDRFSRGFSGEVRAVASVRTHAQGGVRFDEYTQVIPNMPPLAHTVLDATAAVSGVAR